MTYSLEFLEEAMSEWEKLNNSIKQPLKKKLLKVLLFKKYDAKN